MKIQKYLSNKNFVKEIVGTVLFSGSSLNVHSFK